MTKTKKTAKNAPSKDSSKTGRAEPLNDHEKSILRFVRQNKKNGLLRAQIDEKLGSDLPMVDKTRVTYLTRCLRRLAAAGFIGPQGNTKATRWFPVSA